MRTTILVGPKGKERRATCSEYLPGLVLTSPPDKDYKGLVTVTHKESGLFIMRGLTQSTAREVKQILGTIGWQLGMYEIYDSNLHKQVVEAAEMYSNRKRSQIQEGKIADDLGGKVQPGSGAVWGYRRDVITPSFVVEAKTTVTDKHTAKIKDLEFLKKQAATQWKTAAYIVSFEGKNTLDVVLVPLDDYDSDNPVETEVYDPWSGVNITITRDMRETLYVSGKGITFGGGRNAWIALGYEDFLTWAKQHEQR